MRGGFDGERDSEGACGIGPPREWPRAPIRGRRLRDEGVGWSGIGAALGLPTGTVRRLCDSDAAGFARVEVVDDAVTVGGLVVVTPSGFRVEGLDAHGAATLLRQLA